MRTCSTTSGWRDMIACCGPSVRCTNSRSIINTVCWASCFSFYSRNYIFCAVPKNTRQIRFLYYDYTMRILTDWLMLSTAISLGVFLFVFLFCWNCFIGRASHRTLVKKHGTTSVQNNREEIEVNVGNIIQNVPSRFSTSKITIYTCEIVNVYKCCKIMSQNLNCDVFCGFLF